MIADTPANLSNASSWVRSRTDDAAPRSIEVLTPGVPGREQAEAFIEAAYARTFASEIRSHYPILVSLRGNNGDVRAAVGLRFADQQPLFLEQYLDDPIEVALARAFNCPTSRTAIAEIGNLAADDHEASGRLFMQVAGLLSRQGRTHAVATATRQLRRRFRRLGLTTASLAPAAPERLGAGAREWGRYYGRDPEVLAGMVRSAPACLRIAARGGRAEAVR